MSITQAVQVLKGTELINVEGRVIADGLAITASLGGGNRFVITHTPSGRAVVSDRCAEHVEAIAATIAKADIDWTRSDPHEVGNDPEVRRVVLGALENYPLCFKRCNPSTPAEPSWSVRCTTCDWEWEDEFGEGPLDAKAAKEMARDHECEPEVELCPPGEDARWMPEWRVKSDGTFADVEAVTR